ncbi:hypothetical protein ABZ093_34310 [Streptomyces cyaneofuscatus]|uniref:hypothetical protein n=1 Tax=Streptomyces cyaneofuscatus TaxID=66883 RepID=UPI0033B492EC
MDNGVMALTGEKYAQLNQNEPTSDDAGEGRWIACDESGWDGEQLVGRQRRFLVFASVAIDDAEAAPLISTLRRQARIQQAGELKFRLFKDREERWSLLKNLWGPASALHERCSVYVVDKEYAVAAKAIDLLLEEKAHAEGWNLYAEGNARAMARTLALQGPRALPGALFDALMSSFVALASQRALGREEAALEAFFAAVEQAWGASTRRPVTEVLAQVRSTRPYAAALHQEDSPFPSLEMLIPAVSQTARRWGHSLGLVRVLTDEQRVFTDDVFRTVLQYTTSPIGMTLLTRERGAPVHTMLRGSSADHPSIQLADLLAGAAAAVTERHIGNPSPAAEGLWSVIVPLVEQSSLMPYDTPGLQLAGLETHRTRRSG